jgi:hypothetical protein
MSIIDAASAVDGTDSKGEQMSQLEVALESRRIDVEAALEMLRLAKARLQEIEQKAKRSWSRRKAALDSFQITERTARACGLDRSLTTRVSLDRARKRIDAEKLEVRVIVDTATAVCRDFYGAWELVRSAREAEAVALKAIIGFQVVRDQAPHVEQRRREAKKQLSDLQVKRESEEKERQIDLSFESDGLFDPDYDDWEILMRRVRPWV